MTPTKFDRKEIEEAVRVLSNDKVAYANLDRALAHKTLLEFASAYLDNSLSERPMMTEETLEGAIKLIVSIYSKDKNMNKALVSHLSIALLGHIPAPEKVYCPEPEKICLQCNGKRVVSFLTGIYGLMVSVLNATAQVKPHPRAMRGRR